MAKKPVIPQPVFTAAATPASGKDEFDPNAARKHRRRPASNFGEHAEAQEGLRSHKTPSHPGRPPWQKESPLAGLPIAFVGYL
jgi:hypothetical protein